MTPKLKERLVEHLTKTRTNARDHKLLAKKFEEAERARAFGIGAEDARATAQKFATLHHESAELHSAREAEANEFIKFLNLMTDEPIEKVAGLADPHHRELVPTNVHAIAPHGFRMIPRAGQRETSGSCVDPEFEKLVSIED